MADELVRGPQTPNSDTQVVILVDEFGGETLGTPDPERRLQELVPFRIDGDGNLIWGYPVGVVRAPQQSDDPTYFIKRFYPDGSVEFAPVREEDIDSSGLTGWKSFSNGDIVVEFGVQYFRPDIDNDRLRRGVIIQGRVPDEDVWVWGLVLNKDYDDDEYVPIVKLAILRTSEYGGGETYDQWNWQAKTGPLMGFSPDATIGVSGDEMTVPGEGARVEANIMDGKLAAPNVSLLFSDAANLEDNWFRLYVEEYDEDTGDVVGVVTKSHGNETSAAWIATLVPGPPSGSHPVPTELTFFDEVIATGADPVVIPETVKVGDLMVLSLVQTIPDGWQEVTESNPALSVKIATEADIGATVFSSGSAGNPYDVSLLQIFRADVPITSFTVNSVVSGTGGDPGDQTITASAATNPAVVIAHWTCLSTDEGRVDPRTASPAMDAETHGLLNNSPGSFDRDHYLAFKIYNSSPADITIDMDDEGDFLDAYGGFYIEVFGSPTRVGDTVVFQNNGSDEPQYPEAHGDLIILDAHPLVAPVVATANRAFWRGTVTYGSVSSASVTSVNTGTEVMTTTGNHGLTTGKQIYTSGGTWPTGITTNGVIYTRRVDDTNFKAYLTLADALADTNPINLTAAGSGTRNWRPIDLIEADSYGMSTTTPVGFRPASGTTMRLEFNLEDATLSGYYGCTINVYGAASTTPTALAQWSGYSNVNPPMTNGLLGLVFLICHGSSGGATFNGTHAQQISTATLPLGLEVVIHP